VLGKVMVNVGLILQVEDDGIEDMVLYSYRVFTME